MTQPQDKMRAEFEAWAKDRGYQRDELARCRIGIVSPEYFNLNTEMAWQSWRAACAHQSAQSQQDALAAATMRSALEDIASGEIVREHCHGPHCTEELGIATADEMSSRAAGALFFIESAQGASNV